MHLRVSRSRIDTHHIQMSLIGRNHEAGVVVFVRFVYVRAVSHQILDNVQAAVETSGPERRAKGLRRVVDVRVGSDETLNDPKVTGTGRAPECCGSWR